MATPEDDDYEPYDHRETENTTNYFESLINMVKGCIGSGILALPEAFKNAGLVLGLILGIAIGLLILLGYHILLRVQRLQCKRLKVPFLTYAETVKVACEGGPKRFNKCGTCGKVFVDVILMSYQLGICAVYMVFVAVNIKIMIDYHFNYIMDKRIYVIILYFPFLLMSLLRNMKVIAPLSLTANVLMVIAFGIILYYIFEALPSIDKPDKIAPAIRVPIFVGTMMFGVSTVSVTLEIERNMTKPRLFVCWYGVLNMGLLITVGLMVFIGFFGYWRYTDEIESSITLNLDQDGVAAIICRSVYSIALYISFAIQVYPAISTVMDYCKDSECTKKRPRVVEYAVRFGAVTVAALAAVAIPLLGLIISLLGAVCISLLNFVIPGILDIGQRQPTKSFGRVYYMLWEDILVIIVGIAGLVLGSVMTTWDIVVAIGSEFD